MKNREKHSLKMDAENKMALELMSLISKYPYKRHVQYISSRDAMTDEIFVTCEISKTYWIDWHNSYCGGWIRHSNFMFDLFGAFSNEDGDEVRKDIVKRIGMEKSLYESIGHIVLAMRGCNLDTWCEEMLDDNQFPDELMIFAPSHTYNCHTLVMCQNRYWTTLETSEALNEIELFKACHVHLVYLGNGVFAELKAKPFKGSTPHPITMGKLPLAPQQVWSKGCPRAKPLDLLVPKTDDISGCECITKGENSNVGYEPLPHPSSTHENPSLLSDSETKAMSIVKGGNLNCQNTDVNNNVIAPSVTTPDDKKDTDESDQQEALMVIPPEYWLLQPHEIATAVTENQNVTTNQDNVTQDENMKRGNSTEMSSYGDVSCGSKESVMSNMETKVDNLFIEQARQNKCTVPVQRMSSKLTKVISAL